MIDQPVSVTFFGGTLLDALNTIVRAHQGQWELGYINEDNRATIMLTTLEFEGGIVHAPVALPHSRR